MKYYPEKIVKEWKTEFAKEIPIFADRNVGFIGTKLVQISFIPHFKPYFVWDFRELEGAIRVFRSEYDGYGILSKYTPIEFTDQIIWSFLKKISDFSIPVLTDMEKYWGLDGEQKELKLYFGQDFTELSIRWWSSYPKSWEPIIIEVDKIIEKLIVSKESSIEEFVNSILKNKKLHSPNRA